MSHFVLKSLWNRREKSPSLQGIVFSIFVLLVLLALFFPAKDWIPFSDFALVEWQIQEVLHSRLHLTHPILTQPTDFIFFPLPSEFFVVNHNLVYSAFGFVYGTLVSPFYSSYHNLGIYGFQCLLFVLSSLILVQREKKILVGFLFVIGSTLPLYVFLIHETVLSIFLLTLSLWFLEKRSILMTTILWCILPILRPELFLVYPLYGLLAYEKDFLRGYLVSGTMAIVFFLIYNQTMYGIPIGPRLNHHSDLTFSPKRVLYLLEMCILQIPIFLIYLCSQIFGKDRKFFGLFLFVITFIILLLLSPNSGGHNTPRYFFGMIPFACLYTVRCNKPFSKKILYVMVILVTLIFSYQIRYKRKEISNIVAYQKNLQKTVSNLEDNNLVFLNSDFSFASIPLRRQKNLFLVKSVADLGHLTKKLESQGIRKFSILELPPSAFPIPKSEFLQIPKIRLQNSYPLPGSLLPIQVHKYEILEQK